MPRIPDPGRRSGRRPAPAPGSPSSAAPAPALLALLALVAVAALAGCGEPAEPVGVVTVQPTQLTLPYPGSRELDVTWRPTTPVQSDAPWVFVHLLDGEGAVERTFDHPFPGTWAPGQTVTYPLRVYQSLLGPPLPPGEYRLTVGLYGTEGRWPLEVGGDGEAADGTDGDSEVGRQEYEVARVQVPASSPGNLPRIGFLGEWTPLEAGADRQVLGSRWLGSEGSIAVQEPPSAGRLGLLFETPEAPAGVERVMEGSSEEPSLRVTSSCDGSERRLSGTGLSHLEVEVPAGEPCEIRLAPNFRFADPAYRTRAVRLLQLTWDPRQE